MDLGDLFQQLVGPVLMRLALNRLFLTVPFLGWGPIGYIIKWIVEKYSVELFAVIDETYDVREIAFKNKELKDAYTRESVALKIISIDQGKDSAKYKEALDAAKKSLSRFARPTVAS